MIPYFTSNIHHFCFPDLVTPIHYISSIPRSKTSTKSKKNLSAYAFHMAAVMPLHLGRAIIFRRYPLQSPLKLRCWVHFGSQKQPKNCPSFNLATWASCWCFITISPWKPIFTNFTFRIYVGEIILLPNPRGPRLQTSDEHPKFPTNNSHPLWKEKKL